MANDPSRHPALRMSKQRLEAWKTSATDEQFFELLHDLSYIYAKRTYTGNGVINQTKLFTDYKQWRESGQGDTLDMSSSSVE